MLTVNPFKMTGRCTRKGVLEFFHELQSLIAEKVMQKHLAPEQWKDKLQIEIDLLVGIAQGFQTRFGIERVANEDEYNPQLELIVDTPPKLPEMSGAVHDDYAKEEESQN